MLVHSDVELNSGETTMPSSYYDTLFDIVAAYLKCQLDTKYDLIQLHVIINQSVDENQFNDGVFLAII